MKNIILLAVFTACVASAQPRLYGDQNKEYSGLGVYVTVLDEQSEYFGTEGKYGASVIDSNGETTTFAIMPTRLNANQTKYASGYTMTMTIGPTTILYSRTEERTYTDLPFTFAESCSFSGTSIAVCTTSLGGMPRPCDAGLSAGDGFPDGFAIHTSTFSPSVDYVTFEIVTKTTTIKDTDPLPTTLVSGPFPEEWSAPRTVDPLNTEILYNSGTAFICGAFATATNTSLKAALTSSIVSSSTGGTATPSISIAGLNRRETAHVIIAFTAVMITLAVL